MISAGIVSLVLLLVSGLMIRAHVKGWRTVSQHSGDDEYRRYCVRQYRRRMLSSGLIAATAIILLASPIMHDPTRALFWYYWLGLLLVVVSLCGLAMLDIVNTHWYLRTVHRDNVSAHLASVADIKDISLGQDIKKQQQPTD